jgi:phosphohistidine phosphatase
LGRERRQLDTRLGGGDRHPVRLVLDLMRHGHALPAADGDDARRRLSPRGREDLERIALRLKELGWRPDRAFASPLSRARESAQIALRGAAPDVTLEGLEALRPESHPGEILAALSAAGATTGHLFLVGHQPLMGLFAGWLLGGAPPAFPTGCLQRIEFAGPLAPGAGVAGLRIVPS